MTHAERTIATTLAGAGLVAAAGPPADPDELALIAAGFPAFRFWRATCYDRIRYVAQGASLDTHPYAVVTSDLGELRDALAAASGERVRDSGVAALGAQAPAGPQR